MKYKVGDKVYMRAEAKDEHRHALKVTKIENDTLTLTGPDTQTRTVKESEVTDVVPARA